jgi:hypothetical protein
MTDRQHETIYFDSARISLAKATDLPDTVKGGLLHEDRIKITVEGNVLGRKQETRKDGTVEWVKVVDVDKSYDLEVLSRLTELPFEEPHSATPDPELMALMDGKPVVAVLDEAVEQVYGDKATEQKVKAGVMSKQTAHEPPTVDTETGEVSGG